MSKFNKLFLLIAAFGIFSAHLSAQQAEDVRPDFKIECPSQAVSGEFIKVSLNSKYIDETKKWDALTINWTVSEGIIENGQGTRQIRVQTPGYSLPLTITASIDGAYFEKIVETCQTSIEAPRPKPILLEEFPFSTQGYIKMLLDTSLFTQLQNDPSAIGIIYIFPKTPREKVSVERIIRNQIRVRNFDASRITIEAGAKNPKTTIQFWIVPVGAEKPEAVLTPPVSAK